VTIGKDALTLAPLRSAARSFRELRRKFVTGQTIDALKAFTDETGSTVFLQRPARTDQRPARDVVPSGDDEDGAAESGEDVEVPIQVARQDGDSGEGPRKRRRRRGRRGGGERAATEASREGSDTAPDADGSDGVQEDGQAETSDEDAVATSARAADADIGADRGAELADTPDTAAETDSSHGERESDDDGDAER
jgi:hypothetical protein